MEKKRLLEQSNWLRNRFLHTQNESSFVGAVEATVHISNGSTFSRQSIYERRSVHCFVEKSMTFRVVMKDLFIHAISSILCTLASILSQKINTMKIGDSTELDSCTE